MIRLSLAPASAPLARDVAPPVVHDVLRSSGRPLDAGTRAYMEPRFGHSFADVRVHDDARAADSARAVGARAYAVGRDLVFGRGEYRPGTNGGDRLLAHELAHAVQQRSAGDGALHSRLEVGRGDAPEERAADGAAADVMAGRTPAAVLAPRPVLRRTPGEDARESWDALTTHSLDPDETERRGPVDEAITRFLRIPEGARLMNQLWRLFCTADACRTSIDVRFVDEMPRDSESAAGHFSPPRRRASRYVIHVRYATTNRGTLWTQWPVGGDPLVTSFATEGPSRMGETLFHEMLHVWFVNARDGRIAPTGHGDAAAGEYEEEFVERLRTAATEMRELELLIRQEEAEARRQVEERQAIVEAPSEPATAPARRQGAGPAPVGFSAGAQVGVGGFAGRDPAFVSIVGADAILNVLGGMRLGVRGIYMTPEHLFVGPSVGFRFFEEGSRVQRPIFFDLEAGTLFELSPPGASRVSDVVSGFAGAGVGQEYGRTGARFWWRVGGMVIVTDEPSPGGDPVTVGGGGHLGAGVSF